MERVSASLIEEIRSALVERYNRDQEIQQMIEEIGAEEGLNEKELFVIHQAYLEVKERMQYTANLMELWNQIEAVQDRMSMLNSYESLERDLFGDVLSFDKPMGYGASNQDNLDYAMEQVKLHDIDHNIEDIDLSKEYPIDNQDAVYFNEHSANKKTTSSRNDINDDDEENDFDDESPLDRDIRTSLDPYDMVNSLLYSKQSTGDKDKTKQQKEIDKLIKKQLKRVEEWAKLSGKKGKKDKKKKDKKKDKDTKKGKRDKQSKKESELVKESKKSKKDKESKKSKKDKDSKQSKKDKDAKKDKKAKKLEKALKKESKKSTKKD